MTELHYDIVGSFLRPAELKRLAQNLKKERLSKKN